MPTDEQLGVALGPELDSLLADLTPRPDLADQVLRAHRARRRHVRGAATAVAGVAAAGALAVTAAGLGAGHPPRLSGSQLRLSAYRFRLPRDSRLASRSALDATSPSCAMGAYVAYTPGAGEGATGAGRPAIAGAVTGQGGCVSMLLTDPYTPGAPNAPRSLFAPVQTRSITIDGDRGTIGTYEFLGGSDTTIHGVQVPNGTQNTELSLQLPAADGQVQELLVATAGISQQQLESIVASGLQTGTSAG